MQLLLAPILLASLTIAQTTPPDAPQKDSSYIDENGTAHVSRVVPVPKTVSAEAQTSLARRQSDGAVDQTLEQRRSGTDKWQAAAGAAFEKSYRVDVRPATVAGVPCKIVTPAPSGQDHPDRVLVNLHGGGFNSDSGSLTETVPIASLAHTKVIAVLYRLAPEHPFPAAVEDAVAVYKEQLKTYRPENIAIYGTSAGAILTGEVAVRLRQLDLPMPGALGIFSGFGDFSRMGDSIAIYALNGFAGHLDPPPAEVRDSPYVGRTNPRDPVLSPVYAELSNMPPTLFITSTRDLLLSGTAILHRAFLRAGNDAQLVVFEALPHAFWNDSRLPETREADEIMARFFEEKLGSNSPSTRARRRADTRSNP